MAKVEFEEFGDSRKSRGASDRIDALYLGNFLIKNHIAKNKEQADFILICISVIFLLLSGFIFLRAVSLLGYGANTEAQYRSFDDIPAAKRERALGTPVRIGP